MHHRVIAKQLEESQAKKRLVDVSLTELCPADAGNPVVWESMTQEDKANYKANIRDFLQKLRDGQVASIVTREGVAHMKIPFTSDFEKELYFKSNSLKKARLIARNYNQFFDSLSPEDAIKVKAFMARNVNYMGRCMSNFDKLAQKAFSENLTLLTQILAFSKEFAAQFSAEYPPLVVSEGPSVCIATHNGGAAHKTIANHTAAELKASGIAHEIFNENDRHLEADAMKRAIGLDYASLWNLIKQKCGDDELYDLYKELERAIRLFVEDKRGEIFDESFNGYDVVYDTVMHPHYVRAYSHFGAKIIAQICDFGQIPDAPGNKAVLPLSMLDIAQDLYTSHLDNYVIVVPDSHTYIWDQNKEKVELGENKSVDANAFLVLPYPVGKHWSKALTRDEMQGTRQVLNLGNLDEKLLVMMAGGQGVSGVLEAYLRQVLNEAIADIKQKMQSGEVPKKLNIGLLCGTNATMANELNNIFKTQVEDFAAETRKNLSDYVNVQTIGYINNDVAATLIRSADCYITKPGGSTSAECLTAGICNRLVVHCVSSHANELENAQMLERNGAKLLTDATQMPIYKTVMQSQFSPMLNPPEVKKVVVDYIRDQAEARKPKATTSPAFMAHSSVKPAIKKPSQSALGTGVKPAAIKKPSQSALGAGGEDQQIRKKAAAQTGNTSGR